MLRRAGTLKWADPSAAIGTKPFPKTAVDTLLGVFAGLDHQPEE
jgi:hypothetical protein